MKAIDRQMFYIALPLSNHEPFSVALVLIKVGNNFSFLSHKGSWKKAGVIKKSFSSYSMWDIWGENLLNIFQFEFKAKLMYKIVWSSSGVGQCWFFGSNIEGRGHFKSILKGQDQFEPIAKGRDQFMSIFEGLDQFE